MNQLSHIYTGQTFHSRDFELIDLTKSESFKVEEPNKMSRPISFYFQTSLNL